MFGGYAPLPIRLTQGRDGWAVTQHGRACDAAQGLRRLAPYARCSLSTGSATLFGFAGWLGLGLQYRPTISAVGVGVVDIIFAAQYETEFENTRVTNIVLARGTALGPTPAVVTCELLSKTTVRVSRFDAAGVLTDGDVFITIGQRHPSTEQRRIGHYGGAADKEHAGPPHEVQAGYAWWWYREINAGRGSAYRPTTVYLHAENYALARSMAHVTRASQSLASNGTARSAFARLPRYVRDYGLIVRPDESAQEIRLRCAAFEEAPNRNDERAIDTAIEQLLGPLFVRTFYADVNQPLTTPLAPTFWPGVNPGPAAYDLGGGTWLSARAHVVVEVTPPGTMALTKYLELVDTQLFRLLSVRLPATYTFNWATGLSNEDGTLGDGFLLDLSDMDFAGMT